MYIRQYLMLSTRKRTLYCPIGLIRYYVTCLVEIAWYYSCSCRARAV